MVKRDAYFGVFFWMRLDGGNALHMEHSSCAGGTLQVCASLWLSVVLVDRVLGHGTKTGAVHAVSWLQWGLMARQKMRAVLTVVRLGSRA